MQQLPLAVQLQHEVDFADFVAGPNAEAVAAIAAWAEGCGDAFLYLFAPTGSGKTHLLQAACGRAAARSGEVVYLPLSHPELDPSALDNLERIELIALDDLDAVAGNADWERALFGLYNRLREAERRLLVSASQPLAALPIRLPDLRSRLGSGPGYQLRPLREADCEQLLRQSAGKRGLDLSREAVAYIMRRCPRDADSLLALLDEVDRESLREKRRATLWLIRRLLEKSE